MSELQEKPESTKEEFLARLEGLSLEDQIKTVWEKLAECNPGVLEANGIQMNPATLMSDLRKLYSPETAKSCMKEVKNRLVNLVKNLVYGAASQNSVEIQEDLRDIRYILEGKFHLVDCIIDDPDEAKKVEQDIAAFSKMELQAALQKALSGKK